MNATQIESNLLKITVDGVDVFLEDFENGKGKITMSCFENGAFTYYWGSMGSNIRDFIIGINGNYFADKMATDRYVLDAKRSVTAVRQFIRDECSYELPWYKFMSAQKEMRKLLKHIEFATTNNEFVDLMISLPDELCCYDLNYEDERCFKSIIASIFKSEPWNFIQEKTSNQYNWLFNFHGKLKIELEKID